MGVKEPSTLNSLTASRHYSVASVHLPGQMHYALIDPLAAIASFRSIFDRQ
jgi:hypothetical protein